MKEAVNWRAEVFSRLQEIDENLEYPENFDEWLEERMSYTRKNGKPLISDENKEIFYERFRDGKTLQLIGNEVGATRENIRQKCNRVLRNIMIADKILTPPEWKFENDSVFGMPLSPRAASCIYANNITTMQQLDKMLTDGSFRRLRGVGKKTMIELMKMMTDWKIAQEGLRNA